jgi:hypothetical protein
MTRIATPATIADAPAASRPFLEAVAKQLGGDEVFQTEIDFPRVETRKAA